MTDQGTLIQNMLVQYGINNNNNNNNVSQEKRVNFAFSNSTDNCDVVSRTQIIQSLLDKAKNSNQSRRRSRRSRFNFDEDDGYINPDSTTSSSGSSSISSIVTSEMINGQKDISFRKKDDDLNPKNSFFNQPPAKINKVFTTRQKSIFDQLKRTKPRNNINNANNSTSSSTPKLDLGFDFNSFLSNKRCKINQPGEESLKNQQIQNPTKSSKIKKKLVKEQKIVTATIKQKKLNDVETKKEQPKVEKESNNNLTNINNDEFDFIDEMFESKPSNDDNTNKKRKADEMINTTKSEKMEDDGLIKTPLKKSTKKTTKTANSNKNPRKAAPTTTRRRSRTRTTSANKKK